MAIDASCPTAQARTASNIPLRIGRFRHAFTDLRTLNEHSARTAKLEPSHGGA